jgi:hypothetical protein
MRLQTFPQLEAPDRRSDIRIVHVAPQLGLPCEVGFRICKILSPQMHVYIRTRHAGSHVRQAIAKERLWLQHRFVNDSIGVKRLAESSRTASGTTSCR